MPWVGLGRGEVLSPRHEYLTFIVTVQGVFTGRATLAGVLVAAQPDGTSERQA